MSLKKLFKWALSPLKWGGAEEDKKNFSAIYTTVCEGRCPHLRGGTFLFHTFGDRPIYCRGLRNT